MSPFTRFMCVFLWIVSLCAAVLLIVGFAFSYQVPADSGLGQFIDAHSNAVMWVLLLFGILLAALDGLWAFKTMRRFYRFRPVEFKNKRGVIQVTSFALEESLTKTLRALDDVASARVAVRVPVRPRGQIRVRAALVLWERDDVVAAQRAIQDRLEERFREIITTDQPVRFDVVLRRLRSREEGESGAAEEGMPFVGPEYPVRDVEEEGKD